MTQTISSVRSETLTKKNNLILIVSLAILLLSGSVIFGWIVLAMAAVAFVSSISVEVLFAKVRKKKLDVTIFVTPLIFTLILPSTLPLWMVAVGAVFGTFFAKSLFGGSGKNIFNPSIVGALFLLISFPAQMITAWFDPKTNDLVGGATPLNLFNRGLDLNHEIIDFFMGNVPGAVGETFRLGILVLGILLLLLKVADWRIPLSYIGTVFVLMGIGHLVFPETFGNPFMSLIIGGLLFGAFFVATDPVTAPLTSWGRVIYGFGLGFLTVVIRVFGAFQEGVIFAIVIMNAIAPLIDNMTLKDKLNEVEEVTE
ncbi:MAG: RnfABCDGE type electron transport complex subunit D [Tenericutes bacterium]|jgi:RnfABCDGE-type electron transport complex D subunit|nr:RnfABCDGE type electron transport complex subunit D [Mycoplasmatota bacterium]